jgi:hypothetical protein
LQPPSPTRQSCQPQTASSRPLCPRQPRGMCAPSHTLFTPRLFVTLFKGSAYRRSHLRHVADPADDVNFRSF